jgi:aminopeptidase-like protein
MHQSMRVYVPFLALSLVTYASGEELKVVFIDKDKVATRLRSYQGTNKERQARLADFLRSAGCPAVEEQAVKKADAPNVICRLPGSTDDVILVGAHLDYTGEGSLGVVDNWSGASMLANLVESLSRSPRRHSFVFVGFTDEEKGLVGSTHYVERLRKSDLKKIRAMINLECIGMTPLKVEMERADKTLMAALSGVSRSMGRTLTAVNIGAVGISDAAVFQSKRIPTLNLHSINQEKLALIHTSGDTLEAVSFDEYYSTYKVLATFLTYLDTRNFGD